MKGRNCSPGRDREGQVTSETKELKRRSQVKARHHEARDGDPCSPQRSLSRASQSRRPRTTWKNPRYARGPEALISSRDASPSRSFDAELLNYVLCGAWPVHVRREAATAPKLGLWKPSLSKRKLFLAKAARPGEQV